MKYLVCRLDAIHKDCSRDRMIQSSKFPIEVEFYGFSPAEHREGYTPEEAIIRRAFNSIKEGYVGVYDYLVVLLGEARLVSFKRPEPQLVALVCDYV